MTHFDLVQITLYDATLTLLCLFFGMQFLRRKKKAIAAHAPELYIDQEGFSVQGPDWTWLRDEAASYGCKTCHRQERLTFKLYRHRSDERVLLLSCHQCPPGRDVSQEDTQPSIPVTRGQQGRLLAYSRQRGWNRTCGPDLGTRPL